MVSTSIDVKYFFSILNMNLMDKFIVVLFIKFSLAKIVLIAVSLKDFKLGCYF